MLIEMKCKVKLIRGIPHAAVAAHEGSFDNHIEKCKHCSYQTTSERSMLQI